MSTSDTELLDIAGLRTQFLADGGTVKAVDGVNLRVHPGQTLCIVGESGCGKSVTARSILRLVDPPGRVVDGQVALHRRPVEDPTGEPVETVDLAALDPYGQAIRGIRGRDIAMIFQEPLTSLSLVHTVGDQIVEAIRIHTDVAKDEARRQAIELLHTVGIPDPARRIDAYPFQLSGGMRQRVMIAMALSCDPSLLIADEPTTAVDVTTQAQIMDLLGRLQRERGMAIMFITHDMGVVAQMADDVAVMYLGNVVEKGPVDDIFYDPKHPYTRALLASIPRIGQGRKRRLESIRGLVPPPSQRPPGCPFHPRCDHAMEGHCDTDTPMPLRLNGAREVTCFLYDQAETVSIAGNDPAGGSHND